MPPPVEIYPTVPNPITVDVRSLCCKTVVFIILLLHISRMPLTITFPTVTFGVSVISLPTAPLN